MEYYFAYFISFIIGILFSVVLFFILFGRIKNAINRDFIQLANNAIKSEQEDLRKQNREALEEKLKPLTNDLLEFKRKVEMFNVSGVENTTKILEQICILEKNNKSIEQEAKNLTEALTRNQNVKGTYGEDVLDTLLQNFGMQEGIHYIKQYTTISNGNEDDIVHKIRPDVVINLPQGKHLIIDSKVTLSSYLEYVKDNSKLKEFKSEVKKRINDLSNKNYHLAQGMEQPDFVLMYMPIDASVSLLYEDKDIIEYAYKSNVILVGTASLLVTVRLVSQLYSLQKQEQNIKQIVSAGTNLYETFVLLCDELIKIQQEFDVLSQRFTTAINRFKRPNKNRPSLFSQVNELKEYGIFSNKVIPECLLDKTMNDIK